jgi:hypothetical protein
LKADASTLLGYIWEYFSKQMDLFEEVSALVKKGKVERRLNALYPLMFVIIHSARSMLMLSKTQYVTEVFILARAFMERCINLSYLILCDGGEFDNYMDYSMQKGYRAGCSKAETAKLIGVERKNIVPNEWLKKRMDKYTSKKGKPVNRWTDLSFEKRLEFLNNERADLFDDYKIALFKNIYEDASEASHGTLYGALFVMGIFEGTMCRKGITYYMYGYMSLLFNNFGHLVDNIFKVIVDNSSLDISSFIERSKQNDSLLDQQFEEIKKDFE